mmetsp:Transcript_17776/g.41232  ORF Transcript_17776/g.41232 Transcript_17776/m.41232 type:complete len:850 (-) Transcript_17776:13-2562(-)
MACKVLPVLSDDLCSECFGGFEQATLSELRGMVHEFSRRARETSVQQRRLFAELSGTAQSVSEAQERIRQLMPLLDRSSAAEARVAELEQELAAAKTAAHETQRFPHEGGSLLQESWLTDGSHHAPPAFPQDSVDSLSLSISTTGQSITSSLVSPSFLQKMSAVQPHAEASRRRGAQQSLQLSSDLAGADDADLVILDDIEPRQAEEEESSEQVKARKDVAATRAEASAHTSALTAGSGTAGGIRFLLDQRLSSASVDGLEEVHDAESAPVADMFRGQGEVDGRAGGNVVHTVRLSQSTEVLVDRLYNECRARSGAVAVQQVMDDLAGERHARQRPGAVAHSTHQLSSSVDTEVSKEQFRSLAVDALAWRQSQELIRYEAQWFPDDEAVSKLAVDESSTFAPACASGGNRQSKSLPSWSLELGRLSYESNGAVGAGVSQVHGPPPCPDAAHARSARDWWLAVNESFEKLCTKDWERARAKTRSKELPSQRGAASDTAAEEVDAWVPLLEELRTALSMFARGFAEEARARLQAAHAATGRLLEQRRRSMDEMSTQLEAQSGALSAALKEIEQLRALQSTDRSKAELSEVSLAETPRGRSTGSCADQANSPLLQKLPTSSQMALEAEARLRKEQEEVRGELEQQTNESKHRFAEETSAAAAAASAVEERMGIMHGGTWFEKVPYRRQARQRRFVRLSFDLQRIEWASQIRGPVKALPVQAIVRVDYGDASGAYRCYEFAHSRPPPTLCFSIITPSRTLDFIAKAESSVEVWVLGLNDLVPYRPERQRLTAQDFWVRRAMLRLESPIGLGSLAEEELDAESVSTRTNSTALPSASSRGSVRRGFLGFLPRAR